MSSVSCRGDFDLVISVSHVEPPVWSPSWISVPSTCVRWYYWNPYSDLTCGCERLYDLTSSWIYALGTQYRSTFATQARSAAV